jgi:hypothetical protein
MSTPTAAPTGHLAYAPKRARDAVIASADVERHLRAAAECLLGAVESVDPDEQETMLQVARQCLQESERSWNTIGARAARSREMSGPT